MGPTPSTSSPGRTKLSTCIESEHRHKLSLPQLFILLSYLVLTLDPKLQFPGLVMDLKISKNC